MLNGERREMTRRCSHCSNNGHNSRTCPNRGVRLFGVRLTDGSIKKSASMGNLSLYASSTGGTSPPADGTPDHGGGEDGYASEDLARGSNSGCRERKKGIAWTEEEHKMFLLGLQKLGKGDWRGIARNFVVSRTPTQVASHAQKYFIRHSNLGRRKRRTSLFDMVPDESGVASTFPVGSQEDIQGNNAVPTPPALDEECESMDSNSNDGEGSVPKLESLPSYPVLYPTVMTPFYPYPIPFWSGFGTVYGEHRVHEIVKPTAIHPKVPINIDELGTLSKLSLGESVKDAPPSFLSLKLPDGSDRQSAFHAKPPSGPSSSSNPIPAV